MSGRRTQGPPSKAARLMVPLVEGESAALMVRLLFGAEGELVRVLVPLGTGALDPRDQAARRLVQRLDAELARPGAPGIAALRREAELALALAEQLEELEAQHGPAMARAARMVAS
jgi:hypothetical protein